MRFKCKKELYKRVIRKKFAFLPVRLPNNDLIWLEFYSVKGYWFIGETSGSLIFNQTEILNDL